MSPLTGDELWARAAARLRPALGRSVLRLGDLGRGHDGRHVWLARTQWGQVVVKAIAGPFASDRAGWAAAALPALGARGYPVPEMIWHGPLDERWFLVVQARLPGSPLGTLTMPALDNLLALIELQAGEGASTGGWDVSWWIGVVLFEGWEDWWQLAKAAAPVAAQRLRDFVEPAWDHRLPSGDVVHHDLNLSNVLARGGTITGIVDWDDAGTGSRATDLASVLLDWHRLRPRTAAAAAPGGGERLTGRIAAIAGEVGLRCVITYTAVACLALSAQRAQHQDVRMWEAVTQAVLDSIASARPQRPNGP